MYSPKSRIEIIAGSDVDSRVFSRGCVVVDRRGNIRVDSKLDSMLDCRVDIRVDHGVGSSCSEG